MLLECVADELLSTEVLDDKLVEELLEYKLDEELLSTELLEDGTIVEVLAPDVFEVEFCDTEGRTIGFAELRRPDFLVLRHEPALAA